MNKQITDLIAQNGKDDAFNKVVPTQAMLDEAQAELGFPIPEQFLEYLNTYGHGGFGFEILGIGLDGSIAFLEETLEYREEDLPANLLVVENCDEWLYCIDADTGEIVSWSIDEEPCVEFPSFDDFLLSRLEDAVENL